MSMLTFDAEKHEYRLRGKLVDSVTQVLKGLGLIETDFFTAQTRIRGRAAHIGAQLIEQGGVDWASVKATEDALGAPVAPYIRGWERFLRETGWKSVKIEQPNYHPLYEYAGTPDRIGFWPDGQEGLLDIKTGAPQDWWSLQLDGYDQMEPRLSPKGARRQTDVQLTDDGDFKIHHIHDMNACNLFLSMNATYQWGKTHGKYTNER